MITEAPPATDPRERLIDGLADAIAESGYAATTIADIVRHARTSKRTFYGHFADKDECFMAAFRAQSERTLAALADVVTGERTVEQHLRAGLRVFLGSFERRPALSRAILLEIHAAGDAAVQLRREIHQRHAESLRRTITLIRRQHPELRVPSPLLAAAIVGAVNELLLVALERGPRANLGDVERTAITLMLAVLGASEPQR
jgi:AcrR family transcriptional regulator